MAVLASIPRCGARLENNLSLVRWNTSKTYLRELAAAGIPIVPTLWRDYLKPDELFDLYGEFPGREIVLKPQVGAGAIDTYRLNRETLTTHAQAIESHFSDRALMVQPFVDAITSEGEYSLIYFNGVLSHAILKTPKTRDFRVQEEHGGMIRKVKPEAGLRLIGAAVLDALASVPLYARVDLVRANGDSLFWLMELELIEPALYLRMDAEAPARFARAIDARMEM